MFADNTSGQHRTPKSRDRAFGLAVALCLVIYGAWPVLAGGGVRWWAATAGVAFCAVALAFPGTLSPLTRASTVFSGLLEKIVTPAVLAFVFFLVVTPTALAMRILRNDHFRLRWHRDAQSYWLARSPRGPDSGSFRKQF